MLWVCQWGDKEDFLDEVWEKTGIEPQALESKPDLPSYLLQSLRVFNTLHPSRFSEMGIQPITVRDVLAYHEYFELDLDLNEKERLFAHIVSMDTAYRGHRAKQKAQAVPTTDGKQTKS